jgi:hypothetical protein
MSAARRRAPLTAVRHDDQAEPVTPAPAAPLHPADRLDELLAEEDDAAVAELVAGSLPAAGATSTAARLDSTRPADVDTSGTVVALDEAADRWEVSVSTLYRRARSGELPGAHKLPGAKGERWFVPVAAMESAGYRRRVDPAPAAPPPADVSALLSAVGNLTAALTDERRALMAATEDRSRAEREREEARLATARVEGELASERRRVEELTRQLELRGSTRRRWWRSN